MSDTQTIIVQVEPAPPDPERIEDISMLFGLFLVAAVVITCARSLMRLFSVDNVKD
jgi:hypothetical protein